MTLECLSLQSSASLDIETDMASRASSPDSFFYDFTPRSRPIDIPQRRVTYDQNLPFSNTPPRNSCGSRGHLAELANLRATNFTTSNQREYQLSAHPSGNNLEAPAFSSESMTQFEMDHLLLEETLHLAVIDSTIAATSSVAHQASRKPHSHLTPIDDLWTFDEMAPNTTAAQTETEHPRQGYTLSYPMPVTRPAHATEETRPTTHMEELLHPLLQMTPRNHSSQQSIYTSQITRSFSQISAIPPEDNEIHLRSGNTMRSKKLPIIHEEPDEFSDHSFLPR